MKDAFDLGVEEAARLTDQYAGSRWQHFKKAGSNDGLYEIVGFGVNADTCKIEVMYSPIVNGVTQRRSRVIRCWKQWNEHVEREGYAGPRFKEVFDDPDPGDVSRVPVGRGSDPGDDPDNVGY
jgi:hypothetical protein